jgi:hypothetical protein
MTDTVKIAHPIVDGNDLGYVVKERADLLPDDVEWEEPKKEVKPEVKEEPKKEVKSEVKVEPK